MRVSADAAREQQPWRLSPQSNRQDGRSYAQDPVSEELESKGNQVELCDSPISAVESQLRQAGIKDTVAEAKSLGSSLLGLSVGAPSFVPVSAASMAKTNTTPFVISAEAAPFVPSGSFAPRPIPPSAVEAPPFIPSSASENISKNPSIDPQTPLMPASPGISEHSRGELSGRDGADQRFWPGRGSADTDSDDFWRGGPRISKTSHLPCLSKDWDSGRMAVDDGDGASDRDDGEADTYDAYFGGYVGLSGSDSADYYGHGHMDLDPGEAGGSAGEQGELFAGFYCPDYVHEGGAYYGTNGEIITADDGSTWYEAGVCVEDGAALAFNRGDCTYYHQLQGMEWADGGEGPVRGFAGHMGLGSGGSDGDGEAGDGDSGDEVGGVRLNSAGVCSGPLSLLVRGSAEAAPCNP